jgi:hypothetical protein
MSQLDYTYQISIQNDADGLWYIADKQIENYFKEVIVEKGIFSKKSVLVKRERTVSELRAEAKILAEQVALETKQNVRIARLKYKYYSDAVAEYYLDEVIWKNGKWL